MVLWMLAQRLLRTDKTGVESQLQAFKSNVPYPFGVLWLGWRRGHSGAASESRSGSSSSKAKPCGAREALRDNSVKELRA